LKRKGEEEKGCQGRLVTKKGRGKGMEGNNSFVVIDMCKGREGKQRMKSRGGRGKDLRFRKVRGR